MEERYSEIRTLSKRADRCTRLARDTVTGQTVILKSDAQAFAVREARCLLALPSGIAPEVLEFMWHGSGHLELVLGYVASKTAGEMARTVGILQVPALAQVICQNLVHLHRAGFVHTDLKPDNVLVACSNDRFDVRLLDFGFSLDLFGGEREERRGGTLPYLAPEVQRGWIVDGRADLFSLGVMLIELFPAIEHEASWAPILKKLIADSPLRRFNHAAEAQEEIAAVFGAAPGLDPRPRFGTGPAQGRSDDLKQLIDRLRSNPSIRVLIQARSGTGLSRFLLEAVLRVAATGGPPTRMFELPGPGQVAGWGPVLARLRACSQRPGAILCGIDDPSPGLNWLSRENRDGLRRILTLPGWDRMTLSPLEGEDLREILAANLGAKETAGSIAAAAFLSNAEGDLRSFAEGFRRCIEHAGRQDGMVWNLDMAAVQEVFASWTPAPVEPLLPRVPVRLAGPLALCARAGNSFRKELAQGLLERFSSPLALKRLLEHGYLVETAEGRVGFATKRLLRETTAQPIPEPAALDAWLNEHGVWDAHEVEDVIQACSLARRSDDHAKEAGLLSRALIGATEQRRWKDVLRLISYPGTTPAVWSTSEALGRVAALHEILGTTVSKPDLLAMTGASLKAFEPEQGIPLLEQAARSSDATASVRALLFLIDRVADRREDRTFVEYIQALRRWEGAPGGAPPGVLDFFLARRARAEARERDAEESARRARRVLRGTGLVYEALSLQLVAILKFSKDPKGATVAMRAAVAAATDPETDAQLSYNLAAMYGHLGRLRPADVCADAAIRRTFGRISPARLVGLRLFRAWNRAELDLVERARDEARALLDLPSVRREPRLIVPARLLLAFCHLHDGSGREAVSEAIRTWTDATAAGLGDVRWNSLRFLMDAILDLDQWDLVRERGLEVRKLKTGDDPIARVTATRARALEKQGRRKMGEAQAILEGEIESARRLSNRIDRSRYLHHLGLVRLAQGIHASSGRAAVHAVELFREALGILSAPGHRYYRARSLFALSRALRASGDGCGADATLDRAISMSRSAKCFGLLAEALSARADAQMMKTRV